MLEKLHQRMRKVEALYIGATTPGERAAAGNMLQRLRARIAELQSSGGAGSIPGGTHAKWRRPWQARGARGRWVKSNGSGDAHERQEGKARVTFRLRDRWSKYLLLALAKHHGLKPYRNPRWQELTMALAGPEDVLDDLSLQFDLLSQGLNHELARVTRQTIVEKVGPVNDISWLRWGRV
jgi:hypothetical protein